MNKAELRPSDLKIGDFVAYEGPYKFMHYGIVFHVRHGEVALKPLSYLSSRPFNPWSISPHTLKISLDKFFKNLKNIVSHVIDENMMDNQIIAKRKGFIEEKINVLHAFRGLMDNNLKITEPIRSLFGQAQMREIEHGLLYGEDKISLSEDLRRVAVRLSGLPKTSQFLSLPEEERKAVFLYRVSNDADFYVMTQQDELPEEGISGPHQQIVVVLINDRLEKDVYIGKTDLNVLTRWGARMDLDFQPLLLEELKSSNPDIFGIRIAFDG